ncbi:MAG: hypothetical protein QME51_06635 [Planctomycetota bacterium]|nr:hypothetical protein [Planctomycetota bacterium]
MYYKRTNQSVSFGVNETTDPDGHRGRWTQNNGNHEWTRMNTNNSCQFVLIRG